MSKYRTQAELSWLRGMRSKVLLELARLNADTQRKDYQMLLCIFSFSIQGSPIAALTQKCVAIFVHTLVEFLLIL